MRIVLRSLFASRAFAATAIGAIALAISLAAITFAIVDGVLFKPLPYDRAHELFDVMGSSGRPRETASLAAADVEYLRAADPAIAVAAFRFTPPFQHRERPDLLIGSAAIDPHFFTVLGQQPLVGGFSRDDYSRPVSPAQPQPAIVSFSFWRDWLGGDVAAIGRVVEFIDARVVIVGVLPHDVVVPVWFGRQRADVLVPLAVTEEMLRNRFRRGLNAIVRIPTAMSLQVAHARLDAALAAHVSEYPPGKLIPGPYRAVALRPLEQVIGRIERPFFRLAFAVAALLVLLGCINVAGLLTARGREREREFAVRLAVGARAADLARLVLLEAVVIGLAGALLGLLLAPPMLAVALTLLPETIVLVKPPVIDARVIVFCVAAATVTMLLVTALSLRAVVRPVITSGLLGMQTSSARRRSWARSVTLTAESAIGLLLVLSGSLVISSFIAARHEDAGVDQARLGIVEVLTPGVTYAGAPLEVESRHARVLARIAASPDVSGAATIGAPLLDGTRSGTAFKMPAGAEHAAFASDIPVSGRFFEIAGLRVIDGRLPSPQEIDAGRPLAVVSETIARAFWPGQRAVGQHLAGDIELQVIGVVDDARFATQIEAASFGEIYVPARIATYPRGRTVFLFKTSRDPAIVAREVALAVNRDVEGVIVRRAESFGAALAKSVNLFGFRGVLFGVAAVAGLVLLSVGVAGLVAMGVARRLREVGIRVALGAQRGQIGRMIVVDHLRPVAAGLVLGLIASWWTTELLSAFLYGFTPHDARIWAGASLLLVGVSALAAYIPARRATTVDPAMILRVD